MESASGQGTEPQVSTSGAGEGRGMDKYTEIKTLGTGAFGAAVLVRRKLDSQLFVMKKVALHNMSTSERAQTMNEVRVLKQLTHPNITAYYESFVEDNTLNIVIEYADSGDLESSIKKRRENGGVPFSEKEVLWWFVQTTFALKHVHDKNILHRDMKTQNLFLHGPRKMIKLGDFGISKALTTQQEMAQTMVGTPYYLSPELCQGLSYDAKSDIWSLGCILYEIAALKHAFDAENIGALVLKVMRSHPDPIPSEFSDNLRMLVMQLLDKEPDKRPSLDSILQMDFLQQTIHEVRSQESLMAPKAKDLMSSFRGSAAVDVFQQFSNLFASEEDSDNSEAKAKDDDEGYNVLAWGKGHYAPGIIETLRGQKIAQIACGYEHAAARSLDGKAFTWGRGSCGALGHGDYDVQSVPRLVEKLKDSHVISISCGSTHTAVCTQEKQVYCFGMNSHGQLGQGDTKQQCTPIQVSTFWEENDYVVKVSCGSAFTLALTADGEVFSWGENSSGQLGLGSTMDEYSPQLVSKISKKRVQDVCCGSEFSAALLAAGDLWMWGSNSEGQAAGKADENILTPARVKNLPPRGVTAVALGAEHAIVVTKKNQIFTWGEGMFHRLGTGSREGTNIPTEIPSSVLRPLTKDKMFKDGRFVNASAGKQHTAVVTDNGLLITFGCGKEGRLGHGDDNDQASPKIVDQLRKSHVLSCVCGDLDTFCLVKIRKQHM